MFGRDPRRLRPESRNEMDRRVSFLHKSTSRRHRRRSDQETEPRSSTTAQDDDYTLPSVTPNANDSRTPSEADSLRAQHLEPLVIPSPQATEPETAAQPSVRFYATLETLNMNGYPVDQAGQLPPPPKLFARESRVFTSSTDMSTESSLAIRNRLSGYSTGYMKHVTALVKKLTVRSSSDLADVPPFGSRRLSENFHPRGSHAAGTMPEAAFALPGDFLIASTYQRICVCHRHQRESHVLCWCAITDDVSEADGFSSLNAHDLLLGDMTEADLCTQDWFGNTRLHLMAALDRNPERLLKLIPNIANPFVRNSANQTFLHVLSDVWFTGLQNSLAPLRVLLRSQQARLHLIVNIRDSYGTTFLHRLHDHVKDEALFSNVLQSVGLSTILLRDAFDNKAHVLEGGSHFLPPRRAGTFALSPLVEDNSAEDQMTRHHEQLLRILVGAGEDPVIEDDRGRNALHCSAEAIMSVNDMVQGKGQRQGQGARGGGRKRKHGEEDVKSAMANRLETVTVLIMSHVDVNHYDKDGNTVLMAFVSLLDDDADDKDKNLGKIFDALLNAGALIDARNRNGETALLVAARLGRKTALTKLLERGANVHVRDAEGRGILELIEHNLRCVKRDLLQYGRLEACMSLLSGKRREEFGIRKEPSLLDEWSITRPPPKRE